MTKCNSDISMFNKKVYTLVNMYRANKHQEFGKTILLDNNLQMAYPMAKDKHFTIYIDGRWSEQEVGIPVVTGTQTVPNNKRSW